MNTAIKSFFFASLLTASFLLASCSGLPKSSSPGSGSGSGSGTGPFTIGGTVTGMTGTGLVLQDNGGDDLTVTLSPFTFATKVASGGAYAVTVKTQPSNPAQICTVTGGSGKASANVTSVQVTCAAVSATISVAVSGLQGTGLKLQNNGTDSLTITANGTFPFKTPITGAYAVTVLNQPVSPAQLCTVASGTGTAATNVTVNVSCVLSYTIGGTVIGLQGTGMVLLDNSGTIKDPLTIAKSGAFTFNAQLPTGSIWAVAISTQPSSPAQTCTPANNSGTVTANVTNVTITCAAVTYSIGGNVVGLLGKQPTPPNNAPLTDNSFILLNNGGDNLTITQNGPFTFATPVNLNGAYNVSIISSASTQPQQGCTVWGFSGVATANVNNITVDCVHDDWTWIGGTKTAGVQGTPQYGSFPTTPPTNVPNPYTNTPGARELGATWTDSSGNLWLFGGQGFELAGNPSPDTLSGLLNDLWECPMTGDFCQWQLQEAPVSGHFPIAEHEGFPGNYTTSPLRPGGRFGSATWVDKTGNFWLFGGEGIDGGGTEGMLNDLWMLSGTTWTYKGGSAVVNQKGVYGGTQLPGARWTPVTWTDKSGNLWLFGGLGYDGSGNIGFLNDLWEYTSGAWVFVAGSAVANTNGVYGTQGVAASANAPGGRQTASAWVDASGLNLWLFGGEGEDASGTTNGVLNDLWMYDTVAKQWTWVTGSNKANQDGVYGLQPLVGPADTTSAAGTVGLTGATSGIFPGSRWGGTAWTDKNGNLWLFGGWGLDSTGTNGNGFLSDLWVYTPNATAGLPGTWTWVNGSNTGGQNGVYGPETRPYFTHNIWSPGGRRGTMSWTNTVFSQTHLWMLGGQGYDSTSTNGNGFLNDLWRYVPYP